MVLTRKKGESIICILEDGREIEITLSEPRGNQARIRVNADMTIDIIRDELLSKIEN